MQVDELRTERAFRGRCELEACGERSRYAGFMLSKHKVNKRMALQNSQEAQGLVSMVDYDTGLKTFVCGGQFFKPHSRVQ